MALSDKKILKFREKGDIVIEPFDRRNLATSSYDVTLGEFFFRENELRERIYNIWDEDHVHKLWGQPLRASVAKDILPSDKRKWRWRGVRADDLVILIQPGETILGHTEQFIGGRHHITTKMQARSSMGRNFIEVCKCAGWGDVGFFNRWTMEITNNSRHHAIPLVVGRRIAQIVFFETGNILERDYASAGKYQTSDDIEQLKNNWKPETMLPRLYKDREIRQRRKRAWKGKVL